jgi:hypothetical protein
LAKERITVYLEPALINKLKTIFPGTNFSQATAKALELYFESKDYVDWAIRTAVISRATMNMLAQSIFPEEPERQEQFILNSVSKADSWVRKRLREEGRA